MSPKPDPGDTRHFVVIGAGGTGCALLPLLPALSPARITLVDGDTVEATNLLRQPLYGHADIGRLKVDTAAARLRVLHPQLVLGTVPAFMDANNAEAIMRDADMVFDCTDDLHVRRLMDHACERTGTPLISAAVHGHQLQVVTLHTENANGRRVTLRDLYPRRTTSAQDGCDMRSVTPSVTTMAACLMYEQAAALLSGDRSRAGTLELIDMRTGSWWRIQPPVIDRSLEDWAQRTATTGA